MRYRQAILLSLVALFLLMTAVPAVAWDGRGLWTDVIEIENDHPWQDENGDPTSILRVVSPIVVTPVTISFDFQVPSWLTCILSGGQPAPSGVKATLLERRGTNGKGRILVSRRNDLR